MKSIKATRLIFYSMGKERKSEKIFITSTVKKKVFSRMFS